jgi:hypothetical protein
VLGSTAVHSQLVNIPLFATYLLSQRDEPMMNFLNPTSGDTPMRKTIIATHKMSKYPRLVALTAGILMGFSSLAEARVYCYDSYTGEFLHWGACYDYSTPGRTYCYDRNTGNFLYWGKC